MDDDGAETQHVSHPAQGSPHEQPPGQPGAIDIDRLADKVYRLVMEDARLARARGDGAGRREGW